MVIFQTFLSVASMVFQNCLFNNVCKKNLKTDRHIYKFNTITYAVCIVLFGIAALNGNVSFFTVFLGLLFGVVTALSNFYKMCALTAGPMHITLLVTTSSMIIPAMSVLIFKESLTKKQTTGLAGGILSLILMCFVP